MNTTINETISIPNSFQNILNTLDIFVRCTFLTINTSYFLLVFLIKDLQKISYFNMHHSNFIGLCLSIIYCSWINQTNPTIKNEFLKDFVCSLSEIGWSLFRTARAYSILALAAYRYLAVYHSHLFQKVSMSKGYTFLTVALVWFIPTIIFIVFKFAFDTKPGLLCLDGFNSNLFDSITYYAFTTVLGLMMPIFLVVFIYILIHNKLIQVASSVGKNCDLKKTQKNIKESKLVHQFIILNMLEISSCFFWILINVSSWIPNFNTNFYFLRQIWRILNNCSQSIIPIVSIVYHPKRIKFRRLIFRNNKINDLEITINY